MQGFKSRFCTLARAAISSFAALCLCLCMIPGNVAASLGAAYAAGTEESGATIELDCGSGWVVNATVVSGEVPYAEIAGVKSTGSGVLHVPSDVEGVPVTSIGERAFMQQKKLTEIELPASMSSFGVYAFYASGLQNIVVPAGVRVIPQGCFRDCVDLVDVSFESTEMDYFEAYAFAGCGIETFTVPALTSLERNNQIGANCFSDCVNLKTMIFLAGNKHGASNYFTDATCLARCNIETFVFYCEKASVKATDGSLPTDENTYCPVNYYASVADYEAGLEPVAQAVMPVSSNLFDLTQADELSTYEGVVHAPQLPAGKVWGVAGHAISDFDTLMQDQCSFVPVDSSDLGYGWITSLQMREYEDGIATGTESAEPVYGWERANEFYFLDEDGIAHIDNLEVYGPDGKLRDEASYSLDFRYHVPYPNMNRYEKWESIDAVTCTGEFSVRATGTDGTQTSYGVFHVARYAASVTDYTDSDDSVDGIARASRAAATGAKSASFNVLTGSSDWRMALIANSLAGVGSGITVVTDGQSSLSDAYSALVESGSDSVMLVGDTSCVPSAVESDLRSLAVFETGSIDRFSGDDAIELAVDVYESVVKYGPSYGYGWGTTAVLTTPQSCYMGLTALQEIYEQQAPVFFIDQDGSIGSRTLLALRDGGFKRVLVVGSTEDVSESALLPLFLLTDATIDRVDYSGMSVYEASCQISDASVAAGTADAARIVVASAMRPADVVAAAELAHMNGAVLYICTTTDDVKLVQNRMEALGANNVKDVCVVGDFSSVDPNVVQRLSSMYTSSSTVDAVTTGDVFEDSGLLFQVTGSVEVALVGFTQSIRKVAVPDTVSYGGVNMWVTSTKSCVFSQDRPALGLAFTSVSLGKRCDLTANTFKGCSSLKAITLRNTTLKRIPAKCFSGLTSLKTLSISSTKLTRLGQRCFSGCKKLTTLTLRSVLLTKKDVKGALKGSGVKTVKVPKSAVKRYKRIFTKANCGKVVTVKAL